MGSGDQTASKHASARAKVAAEGAGRVKSLYEAGEDAMVDVRRGRKASPQDPTQIRPHWRDRARRARVSTLHVITPCRACLTFLLTSLVRCTYTRIRLIGSPHFTACAAHSLAFQTEISTPPLVPASNTLSVYPPPVCRIAFSRIDERPRVFRVRPGHAQWR